MATLERPRPSEHQPERPQHDSSSTPPTFIPSAVPSAFLPPLASPAPAQQQEDDLLDLGQERLFSGTRTTARGRGDLQAGREEQVPLPAVEWDGGTADGVQGEQDLLTSLGAARQAFLFALSGVLGQHFTASSTAAADPFADPASSSSSAAAVQPPDVLLTSLLDTLRSSTASSSPPPSTLPAHLRPSTTASPAMLSIERSSPLLSSPRSAASASPSPTSAQPLLEELQARVEAATTEGVLPPTEAELARALVGLLTCIERLATISRSDSDDDVSASPPPAPSAPSTSTRSRSPFPRPSAPSSAAPANVYSTLEQQAALLQARRDLRTSGTETVVGAAREVEQAERELLWGRVDDLSERVGRLARLRGEGLARPSGQVEHDGEEEEGKTRSRSSSLYEPSLSDLPRYSKEHDRQSAAHLPPGYYADLDLDGLNEKERLRDDWDVKPPRSPSLQTPQTLAAAAFASASTATAAASARHRQLDPEKMQRDLDNVTSAIERLYVVSPQLANQRVEPDRRLQRERQLAKLGNAIERLSQGRLEDQRAVPSPLLGEEGEEETVGERRKREQQALDRLLDQIDKAASRTLADQRVELNGKRKEVLNSDTANPSFSAADKYEARRREYILSHTGKGRLAGQDAVLPSSSSAAAASGMVEPLFPAPPAELSEPVTISEFFRDEAGEAEEEAESKAGDEAIRGRSQAVPLASSSGGGGAAAGGVKKKFSSRALFQPRPVTPGEDDAAGGKKGSLRLGVFKKGPGAAGGGGSGSGMLRRSSYDATGGMTGLGVFGMGMSRSASAGSEVEVLAVPQFDWITEESRNLGTLVVTFWSRSSSSFSRDEDFEVLAVEAESILVAPPRGGPASRLSLPCRVVAQQTSVSSSPGSGIYEVKLVTSNLSPTKSRADLEIHTPLSTDELRGCMPTSFACSVCNTTIADTTSIMRYNALPSEHWAELLDAWMCHQDQELSADLIAKGKGIKPRADEGLVGTSYVLVPRELTKNWETPEGSEPTRSPSDDLLYPAHCTTCSSLIGSHVAPLSSTTSSPAEPTSFRLLKYATYPIRDSSAAENGQGIFAPAPRYSLAAFLTAEMLETGQAHACHRFVVEEAETEEAKLLLWFFNPAVRLSFSTSSTAAGEVLAAPSNSSNTASSPHSIPSPASSNGSLSSSSVASGAGAVKLASRSMNAVKIFYSLVSSSSDPPCVDFAQNQKAETVLYPSAVVARLADLLKASTLVYPSAKRKFGEMEVGFLERI